MSITLAAIGLAAGAAGATKGALDARKAARERRKQISEQKAKNEAWYARNYHEDYLNSVAANNAVKRVRDSWSDATREARARQAVAGGTPEQAAAVAEAGGEAMANTVGNLAAQGEANKRAIDAQKQAMDANIAAQEGALADAEQQAGMNLVDNGIGVATSAAQMFGAKKEPKPVADAVAGAIPGSEAAVAAGRETRINPPSYTTAIVTPSKELSQEEKNVLGVTQRGY